MNDKILTAVVAVDNTTYSFDRLFSYIIPSNLTDDLRVGMRIIVPFGKGNKRQQGMVMDIKLSKSNDKLKSIISILDNEPLFTKEMISTAIFIHDRYFCTYYDAVRVMLPAGINYKITTFYSSNKGTIAKLEDSNDIEKAILNYLISSKKPISEKTIIEHFDLQDNSYLVKLSRDGFLDKKDDALRKIKDATIKMVAINDDIDISSVSLSPKQDSVLDVLKVTGRASVKELCYFTGVTSAVVDALVKKDVAYYFQDEVLRIPDIERDTQENKKDIILSKEQQKAYDNLLNSFNSNKPNVSLLYGITGSGKTSVFIKLIEQCYKMGKDTIVMVPEIALTPQAIKLFINHFGRNVAVFHSGLSLGERLDEYKRVQNGDAKIVIGTRSAVFAPFKNLGLIIIDEEQESSYKSECTPRYHARDIAKFRAYTNNAMVVLSSATPSLESYYNSLNGTYDRCVLKERYGTAELPQVIVADMNIENESGNYSGFSNVLLDYIEDNLKNNKQSIILLNRRGHNTFVSCKECKETVTCPNCSISLTYHSANNRLMCHYCGYSIPYTDECPTCHKHSLRFSGAGTQMAEKDLSEFFPNARILRMDTDATLVKSSHERKLTAFANHEYDILVGTQMVAKGLNFPDVTLVGVLNADQMLYSDDYRSYEKTFSLLTQVVGRSGRGKEKGIAIIQSYTPENPVILLASQQDYEKFYNSEIGVRKAMLYPPFADICLVGFSGANLNKVVKSASTFQQKLISISKTDYPRLPLRIIGPSPATVYKISNNYRYKIIIKCKNSKDFRTMLKNLLSDFNKDKNNKDVSITVDTNPQSFN